MRPRMQEKNQIRLDSIGFILLGACKISWLAQIFSFLHLCTAHKSTNKLQVEPLAKYKELKTGLRNLEYGRCNVADHRPSQDMNPKMHMPQLATKSRNKKSQAKNAYSIWHTLRQPVVLCSSCQASGIGFGGKGQILSMLGNFLLGSARNSS